MGPKSETSFKLHQHRRRRRRLAILSEIRLPDQTQTLVVTGGAVAFLMALALSVFLSLDSYAQAVAQGSNYTGQPHSSPATEAHKANAPPPATPRPAPYAGYRVAVPAPLTPDPAERVVLPVEDEV